VLVGAATHGTSEFYRWRAELTKRLVAERGFDFVGVEGDWTDCHRLHCCVAGAPGISKDPAAVLWELRRWPRWPLANEEVVDFAGWLREFNARRSRPVGFHGLDVYRLWDSTRAVPASLPGLDPAFPAWLNTEVPADAERYYRELLHGDHRSWNARERHLADTLERLAGAYGSGAKAVVWAHNTHVGDAAATDMAAAGMTNLGRLVRERHGEEDTVLVGFGTYEGSVLAARRWDGPARRLRVPPAAPGSVEARWHEVLPDADGLVVFPRGGGPAWAGEVRGHRATDVVYDGDRPGDYVPTVLRRRYDAFVHCDRTTAVTPLHRVETRESLSVGE
jgi:erythromycin esterase-like protein